MSLARQYRLKFAVQRGDRLVLYLACAVAVHVGIMAVGLKIVQTNTAAVEPVALQPIEFVYLDSESSEPPLNSERTSNRNSQAAGEVQLDLSVSAGKPQEEKISEIVPNKPLMPSEPGTYIPTQSQSDDTSKAVEPVSSDKPEPSRVNTSSAPQSNASATGVPLTVPSSSAVKPDPEPTSTPRLAAIPLPTLQPAAPINMPTDPSTDAVTDTVTPAGMGLDGLPNPNRTAANDPATNSPTIDAQADAIWGQYRATLTQAIYQHWQPIDPDVTRETLIRFEIDRQGRLIKLEVTHSSGLAIADQTAIDAIQSAAPFAPLPLETSDPSAVINFTFTHTVRSPR